MNAHSLHYTIHKFKYVPARKDDLLRSNSREDKRTLKDLSPYFDILFDNDIKYLKNISKVLQKYKFKKEDFKGIMAYFENKLNLHKISDRQKMKFNGTDRNIFFNGLFNSPQILKLYQEYAELECPFIQDVNKFINEITNKYKQIKKSSNPKILFNNHSLNSYENDSFNFEKIYENDSIDYFMIENE